MNTACSIRVTVKLYINIPFESTSHARVLFSHYHFRFSLPAIDWLGGVEYVTMLVDPVAKELAIRPSTRKNRASVKWANKYNQHMFSPTDIRAPHFLDRLYRLMCWDASMDYSVSGQLMYMVDGPMMLFALENASAEPRYETQLIISADPRDIVVVPITEIVTADSILI